MASRRPGSARPHVAQRTTTGRGSRSRRDEEEDLEYECKACYLVILDDLDDEINSKEQLSKCEFINSSILHTEKSIILFLKSLENFSFRHK